MCVEREFAFQLLEMLEGHDALWVRQVGKIQNWHVWALAMVFEPHHLIRCCVSKHWDQHDGQFTKSLGLKSAISLAQLSKGASIYCDEYEVNLSIE